jgi:hypothetical protein
LTGSVASFPHDVAVVDPLWIPLSDGTRLAARLWRPVGVERAPVVLEYLPYRRADGTDVDDAARHRYFAGHGFASVRVDIRGSGDSGGVLADEYSAAEIADGVEVVAWLAAQRWCSGRVGLVGISWGGFNALQIAAEAPPVLCAIVTVCSTDDRFADDVHYVGGAVLARDMPGWAATLLALNARPPDPAVVGAAWREEWHTRVVETPAFLDTWLTHGTRDAYWRRGSVCEDYAAIRCPVLAVGGWADGYPNAVFRLVEHLPNFRRGIVGPWAHAWPHAGRPGPRIGFLQECLRWWRRWLRDEPTGVESDAPMRAWIDASDAPQVAEAAGEWRACALSRDEVRFALPPQTVVAHLDHGRAAGEWCPFGAQETAAAQGEDDARAVCVDVPVLEDLVILGRPRLHFRPTTTQMGGHVVVRLCEVGADGRSLLLSWGVATVGAGRVDLKATGRRVRRGHRMRVALARTYWPVVWPARDLRPLDLGALELVLPLAAPGLPVDFATPAAAPPGEHAVLARGSYLRIREDGVSRHVVDGGEVRHGNGIVTHSWSEDRLVLRDDADAARVECRRHLSLSRDAWRVDVRVTSVLRTDGSDFVLDVRLDAEERDGPPVAPRTWHARLPRPPE